MRYFSISKTILWVFLILGTAAGCASKAAGPYGYTELYLQARDSQPSSLPVDRAVIERFVDFYNPLDAARISGEIEQIYAHELYFNDTLVTLTDRDALTTHLQDTAAAVNSMSLRLIDVLGSSRNPEQQDVFLLWEMETRFSILGKERLSRTIGISQLRFNARNQVIFHQDFWDSSQGLDQHIPLLGPLARWLRNHPDPQ